MPTPTASDLLTRKTSVPSEMNSAQWNAYVSAQLRERAFFMAGVANAQRLSDFRRVIEQVARGDIGRAEARKRLRMQLDAEGYTPAAGLEGTMKDLRTEQRLRVTVDTNVDLAAGWAQRQQLLGDDFYPALELYRAGSARAPRDWQRRWAEAAAAVGNVGVAAGGSMIALTESPIWARLSRFGEPYPPFDYGSHMRVRAVDAMRCEQLQFGGAEPAEETLPPEAEAPRERVLTEPSLNGDTSADVSGCDAEVLRRLQEELQGIAELDGGRLRMTDPNGTRPYSADEVGRVVAAPLPEGVPNLQARAWRDWVADSRMFAPHSTDPRVRAQEARVSLNEKEDCARLFRRIVPETADIYRGLSFSDAEKWQRAVASFEKEGYGARKGYVAESWSTEASAALRYAGKHRYRVVLVCRGCREFRPFRGLYREVGTLQDDAARPKYWEQEGAVLPHVRMRVTGRQLREDGAGNVTLTLYVQER